MVNPLFTLIELFFAIYYGSGVMMRKLMCTAQLFSHGGQPLCTQILPRQRRLPSTALGIRKLETLGYPTVNTSSFCVPSLWHNTWVWRKDRQMDGFVVAYIQRLQS